ncbi:hypothetical protein M3Y97_00030500 [Aphelenchoides bicaudatus]|nr:hypothetical protein M3Y97_00030500 [Aphelenchoides bicaudatus]
MSSNQKALAEKALGNEAYKKRDFSSAHEHYKKAIELDPTDITFYTNNAAVFFEENQFDECIEECKKGIEAGREHRASYTLIAKAYARIGNSYLKKDDKKEALFYFGKSLSEHRDMDLVKKHKQLEKEIQEEEKRNNPELAEQAKSKSKEASKEDVKTHEQAKQESEIQAILSDPIMMYILKQMSENPKSAAEHLKNPEIFQKMLKLLLRKALGNEAYKKRDFDAAHEHYKKAIELDPTDITFYTNNAAVFFEENRFDECIAECEKATEVGREHRASYTLIAKAYARIGNAYLKKDDKKKALFYFGKSLSEHRDADLVKKHKQLEKEIQAEEKRAYVNPELAEEEKIKGNEAFKKGDYPTAIKHYTEAVKRNPENHIIYSNRAACFTKLMEFQRAIDDCDICIKKDPKFLKAHLRKGGALQAMHEYGRAQKCYEDALAIEPSNREAMDGLISCNRNNTNPEKSREQALQDPEIQAILGDPAMRVILEQMSQDPKSAAEHMKNPDIFSKIMKLRDAGIVDELLRWTLTFYYYLLFKWRQRFEHKQQHLNLWNLSEGPNNEELQRELLDKNEEKILFQGSDGEDNAVFIEIRLTKEWIVANLFFLVNGKKFILSGEALRKPRWLSTDHLLNIGPLRIELREPFERWRVSFRGDLRDSDGHIKFVHWQSWWAPLSDPFEFVKEVPIKSIAKCVVKSQDSTLYDKFTNCQDFLQYGMFRSRFIVETNEPIEFDLRGFRLREESGDFINLERLTTSFMTNGDRTARFELAVKNCTRSLELGHKLCGTGFVVPLDCPIDDDVEHIAIHSLKFGLPSTTNLEFSRLLYKNGTGFTWFVEGHKTSYEQPNWPPLTEFEYKATEMDKQYLILPFTHRAAMDSQLTGGKGANLARLTGLQLKFSVPRGLVVTVAAFQRHLKENIKLKEFLISLKNKTPDNFESVEEKCRQLFSNTKLSAELTKEINNQLEQIFEDRRHQVEFAVRSSAVGEDGAELSSAGQLESYLHVGLDEIAGKVLECWASNFRREIMNYRYEHGQPLNTPMAVVIQEMVSSGIAGVMFTNDPVKGDPSKIVLNLVEGDGEGPYWANSEFILNTTLSSAQDVEFVCKSNRIYVVQSRNITNLDIESDWELKHEFDSALLSPDLLLSTANVGEVYPTPLQALDCSVLASIYDRTIRTLFSYMAYEKLQINKHGSAVFLIHRQRVFFELIERKIKSLSTTLAGTKLFNDDTINLGRERYGKKSRKQKVYDVYKLTKMIFFDSKKINKQRSELLAEMKLCTVPDDMSGILRAIESQRQYLVQLLQCHASASLFANMCYVLTAIILRGSPEGDVSPELFAKIASIYSNNPEEVKIAYAIKANKEMCNKFNEIACSKEAVDFLKTSEIGKLFCEFLSKHGHRGHCEIALMGTPWIYDHENLISTLRLMINDSNLEKPNKKGAMDKHAARRRQKIYESQAELSYPLISTGRPIPIETNLIVDVNSDLKLHGTTVCEGRVIGSARVVKSLKEAKETKAGEILITTCTDIAWSPLFPILKGLVTEIGGLLSHGAVVAREYSLPCIIAVENATNQFKTGDRILLDASKGIVERLQKD